MASVGKKNIWWIIFFFGCLVLFTLFKLPLAQFDNLIENNINAQLRTQGITLRSKDTSISILTLSYSMKEVEISIRSLAYTVKLDELTVSPSILSLFSGKVGGSAYIKNKGGDLDLNFAMAGQEMDIQFSANNLDLAPLEIFDRFAKIKGNAVISGSGNLRGNFRDLSTLDGSIDVKITKLKIEQQKMAALFGMEVPELNISETILKGDFEKGRVKINTVKLGKSSPPDDIAATITGTIKLDNNIRRSEADLVAKFKISDSIQKISPLVEQMLNTARMSDGQYGYQIKGPIGSSIPVPLR